MNVLSKIIIYLGLVTLVFFLGDNVRGNPIQRLEHAVENYQRIADHGGWEPIPMDGPVLKMGVCHPHVGLLRMRLWWTSELPVPWSQEKHLCFDEEVDDAVRQFQKYHGLKVDGAVGNRETKPVLNVPVEQWLERIKYNLNKPSILPGDEPDFYILVNVPAFKLYVISHGKVIEELKVITGMTSRQTPEFADSMKFVVFNPYWHVPSLLAHRDKIPDQIKDPGYFERYNIKVLDTVDGKEIELDPSTIDWTKFHWQENRMPYKLRQEPGEKNFLGNLKFIFPNRYGVYIHDTPSKHLFGETKRTYSSGCVRVQNPRRLAEIVLGRTLDDSFNPEYPWGENPSQSRVEAATWTRDRIDTMLSSGERKWVRLPQEVPVYIVYYTAWVDENMMIRFYPDIYKRHEWTNTQITCNSGSVNNTCNASTLTETE